jgi:hypothetical protein
MFYDAYSQLLTLSSRFLEKITSGEIEITADQFPNFLYDEANADPPSGDEEWNVENGLLCSTLCLWVRGSVSWSCFEVSWKVTGLQMCFHGQWILVAFGEEKKISGW